jgi:hypothetical protein
MGPYIDGPGYLCSIGFVGILIHYALLGMILKMWQMDIDLFATNVANIKILLDIAAFQQNFWYNSRYFIMWQFVKEI